MVVSDRAFLSFLLTDWVRDGKAAYINYRVLEMAYQTCLSEPQSWSPAYFSSVVLVPGVVPPGPEPTSKSERSQTLPGRLGTSTTKPLTSLETVERK